MEKLMEEISRIESRWMHLGAVFVFLLCAFNNVFICVGDSYEVTYQSKSGYSRDFIYGGSLIFAFLVAE
ncbi:hypothetical protein L195_g036121, partial [Trifolium pratense]